MRYILLFILVFTVIIRAQGNVTLVDSSFKYFYLDERLPLPFSPDNSLEFGLQDTSDVLIVIHKVLPGSSSIETDNTIPVDTLFHNILPGGKYKASWKNRASNLIKKNELFVFYFYAYRRTNTVAGKGYIVFQGKSKVIFSI